MPSAEFRRSPDQVATLAGVDPLATPEQNPDVARNKRDVAHFEAIGQALAAARDADIVDATVSSPAERVRAGFLLGDVPHSVAVDAAIEAEALGQIGLANRRPLRSR